MRIAFTSAQSSHDGRRRSPVGRRAGPRRRRRRPRRGVRRDRAAHRRAPRARALRRDEVHDGAARGLVPPGDAAARRAHGRLGGALLLAARGTARAGPGPARALHVGRHLRGAAREARRARRAPRRDVPRARRREPARRPRGRGAERGRLLRQEHDADHAPPRLLGRARDARHRRRARADAAARHRLRRLPALHRRLPDRRARRAGDARRDPLPLVLDAGAARRARVVPRRARRAGLRLRHLPGRLPVEPRRREAPRPPRADRHAGTSTSARWLESDGAALVGEYDRLYVPRNDPRWLRRNALVALGNVGDADRRAAARALREGDDELLAEHAAWALAQLRANP